MNRSIKILNSEFVDLFKTEFEVQTVTTSMTYAKESHIPLTSLILVDGGIEFYGQNGSGKILAGPMLLGLPHLVRDIASKCDCRILPDSKVIFIGKTEVLSILDEKESPLRKVLKETISESTFTFS